MINKSKAAVFFDILWFLSFLLFLFIPIIFPNTQLQRFGFALPCLIGCAMIFSNRIKDFSIVGTMLYWFSLNVMKPRTEFNHIFWGIFLTFFSIFASFFGDKPNQSSIEFSKELHSSYEYWMVIVVVLLLNILVGIYTAKKYK